MIKIVTAPFLHSCNGFVQTEKSDFCRTSQTLLRGRKYSLYCCIVFPPLPVKFRGGWSTLGQNFSINIFLFPKHFEDITPSFFLCAHKTILHTGVGVILKLGQKAFRSKFAGKKRERDAQKRDVLNGEGRTYCHSTRRSIVVLTRETVNNETSENTLVFFKDSVLIASIAYLCSFVLRLVSPDER